MMKRYMILLLVVLCFCFSCACNKKPCKPQPIPEAEKLSPEALTAFADQNNDFAFRLFAATDAEGKNLFFSPYSISTALSMAYGGAKGNTAIQMAKALSFELPEAEHHLAFRDLGNRLNLLGTNGKAELSVANGVFQAKFYEKLLLESYRKLLQESYGSDIYSLDFADAKGASEYINKWVLDRTNQRIRDLVSEQHIRGSNNGMVLVNAIFFKGKWQNQFDPKATRKDKFYISDMRIPENSKPVDLMYRQGDYAYAELAGFQILELPYEEEDLAMLVILPDEKSATKPELNPKNLRDWQSKLQTQEVKLYLPRFSFDLSLEGIPQMLKSMGMIDAFSDVTADFTGIRKPGTADLYIMDILHKAFVEVKEEGTEAAAATAVIMATKAAMGPAPKIPVFRADHPFIYMIMHKPSGSVLFMGKFAEPPKL